MAPQGTLSGALQFALGLALFLTACAQPPANPAPVPGGVDAVSDVAAATDSTDSAADLAPDGEPAADVAPTPDASPDATAPKCTTSDDCPAALPACLPATGTCVECRWADHCPQPGSRCIANQCAVPLPCTSSKQCNAAGAVCDAKAGFCVDCLEDADCGKGLLCTLKQCLPKANICTTSKDCASAGLVCGGAAGCVDCTADGDCGGKEFCSQNLCVPDVCLAGAATCTDDSHLGTCSANGGVYAKDACPGAKKCKNAECKPVVCSPGGLFCQDQTLRKCDSLGVDSEVVQDCAASALQCYQGACAAQVCKPGATECQAGKVATCNANGMAWESSECPAKTICDKGKCEAQVCSALAKLCSGNQLMQCDAKGLAVVPVEDCALTNKICDNSPTGDGGSCMAQVCKPGATQCVGKQIATCNAKGLQWTNADCAANQICQAGACKALACAPAALACIEGKAAQCNATGTAYTIQQDCAATKELCIAGKCVAQLCLGGAKVCQGGKLATCNGDGLGYTQADCAPGTVCDQGACKVQVCTPNAKNCVGNKVAVCDGLGLATTPGPDCAATQQVCVNGACAKSGCWPAGAVQCVNGLLGTCKADASGWDLKACEDGNACTTDACDAASNTCKTTGTKNCDDGNKCTKDSCNAMTGGCVTEVSLSPCDDGNGCTVGETCASGTCAPAAGWVLSTLAGAEFFSQVADGPAKSAQFSWIYGIAVTPNGNVWLADSGVHRIRRLDAAGNVTTVVGVAGAGFVNGQPGVAKLSNPQGLARDGAGSVYVADTGNHAIRRVAPDGFTSTYAGGIKGYVDGDGKVAQFSNPTDIALDPKSGWLYVADSGNQRIRAIKPGGQVVTVCGSGTAGFADGACTSAQFNTPDRIAVSADGGVLVADSGNLRVRKIGSDGQVTTIAGSGMGGYTDGAASSAKFSAFTGILAGASGEIYVSESVRVRRIAAGQVTTVAGGGGGKNPGPATEFSLNGPRGLAYAANYRLLLADKYALRALDPTGGVVCNDLLPCTNDSCDAKVSKCVFTPLAAGAPCDDGTACTASSACDGKGQCSGAGKNCTDGNPCTADTCDALSGACDNHPEKAQCSDSDACTLGDQCIDGACVVDKASLKTIAGSTKFGYSEAPGADAAFAWPAGMALDPAGGVYVADSSNHVIRKVSANGAVVRLAGQVGKAGYADGNGDVAQFNFPYDVAPDAQGRLVIPEISGHRVRLYDVKTNQVTTLAGAGTAGYADGAVTSAQFNQPVSAAVAANGDIYIGDRGNRRIRKIANGQVSTVAGSGGAGKQDGAATSATFSIGLAGIALGPDGAVYVADAGNHAIRRIHNGEVSTWAGTAGAGFADGSLALAKFNGLSDIAFDGTGAAWIADNGNYRLRRVAVTGIVTTEIGTGTPAMVDGIGTLPSLAAPLAVAVGSGTSAWIADSNAMRLLTLGKVVCEDGKPCTADVCNKVSGQCSYANIADGGPCSATKCMSGEKCSAGKCGGGAPTVCDDKSTCTNDSCDVATGQCVFAQNGSCCPLPVVDLNFDDGKPTGFVFSNTAGPTKGWQVWATSTQAKSGTGVLYYGDPVQKNFSFGTSNGTAALAINLAGAKSFSLSFDYYFDGEMSTSADKWSCSWNDSMVYTKSISSSTFKNWTSVSVNVNGVAGQNTLKFLFTANSYSNSGFGLAIDNLKVIQPCN